MKSVVILGAGFGGLEVATRLSRALADQVRLTLIDKADSFIFGFSKLDVMFGDKSLDDVRLYYRHIKNEGVNFVQETVTSIDPVRRHVVTDRNAHDADILVVALGADYDPDATPGFVEGGHDFYSHAGAARIPAVLSSFRGGKVIIAVLSATFKCPPAPFEAALLLHDHFVRTGIRDSCEIRVISPLGSPIPVSEETSRGIVSALEQRRISSTFGDLVVSIDPEAKTASLASGGSLPYDLFIGIPVHRAPAVVEESGMTVDGWIPVDQRNLATRYEDVYALGDVASAPVPRAGVFAETAARAVADDIAAKLGGFSLQMPYDGTGSCYIEFGGGLVGKVDADFLSGPSPTAELVGPSFQFAQEKTAFAVERRRRWFGD